MTTPPAPPLTRASGRTFFGHPLGLMTLFFSEMWERFSYYGMRTILMPFMVLPTAMGGLGFSVAKAGIIYAIYTSMVYLASVPGGWLADKFLGQRRAVLYGGIGIMAGHICLALPALGTFYLGLGLIVLGTGLLKPNISTIVGQLYERDDPRRDSGFSLYYMGINVGAFLGTLLCAWFAQDPAFQHFLARIGMNTHLAWHVAFATAAVGMAFGMIQYVWGYRLMGESGLKPTPPRDAAEAAKNRRNLWLMLGAIVALPGAFVLLHFTGVLALDERRIGNLQGLLLIALSAAVFWRLFSDKNLTTEEKRRMIPVPVLFFGAAVFFGIFEQAGSTLNLFATQRTTCSILGWQFPPGWMQNLNSVFVILLSPVMAAIWLYLGKRKRDPSSPTKFGVAMLFVAAGVLVMIPAARMTTSSIFAGAPGTGVAAQALRVGPLWLTALYFLHTIGELMLSPVGLSSMTKLAPASHGGLIMGIWFLGTGIGDYISGIASSFSESVPLDTLFIWLTIAPLIAAVIFFALVRPLRRLIDQDAATAAAALKAK